MPATGEDRAEVARKAVLEFLPKGIDEAISEFVAGIASERIGETDDDADLDELLQELEDSVGVHLEEHLSASDVSSFCRRVVAKAFGKAGDAGTSGQAAAAGKASGGGTKAPEAKAEPAAAPGKAKAKAKGKAKANGYPTGAGDLPGAVVGDTLCRVENLMLMYGGSPEPLLRNTVLELIRGHRYGVVGANGAGKTTLMSRIALKEIAGIPKTLTCVHLRHEAILDGIDPTTPAREYARLRGGVGGKAVTATEQPKLERSLTDVGFTDDLLTKAVSALSGGWRMRLALACAMAQKADVLLLDEPTNHLDKKAVEWLIGFINRTCIGGELGGTAMIVSHDPDFLNQVCTDVVHFTADGKLAYHAGNFDAFKKQALGGSEAEAKKLLEVMREANISGGAAVPGAQNHLIDYDAKMSFPTPGNITNLSVSKPVLELRKASFQYDEARPVLKDVTVRLTQQSRVAVVGRNGAGKSTMMSLIAGDIQPCALDGETDVGELWRHKDLRVAYIAQQHMFHLSRFLDCEPYVYIQKRFRFGYDEEAQERLKEPQSEEERLRREELARKYGKRGKQVKELLARQKFGKELKYEVHWEGLDDPKQNTYETLSTLRLLGVERMAAALDDRLAARASGTDRRSLETRAIVDHLKPFGLDEDIVTRRPIKVLSAGQKSKLMLGAAFWTKPHIICLDEPTNYLDVETVEALARALRNFKGGCIVITHNEKFTDDVCKEIWEVDAGRVTVRAKDGGPAKQMKAMGNDKKKETDKRQVEADKKIAKQKGAEEKEARSHEESLAIYLEARGRLGPYKKDIHVESLHIDSPNGKPLIKNGNLQLVQGQHYGLVGRNGAGKSTLLRAVARYDIDKFPKNVKVLLVEQEAAGDTRKPLQTLLDSDIELVMLRKEEKELSASEAKDPARLKVVYERLEEIGAADAEARAMRILRGLQFTPDLLEKETKALSGGWRMRVSLAMALFAKPDLLLLDEPTNHLDFPAVLWLEDYLNSDFKEKSALIVSHDRHFLDKVAGEIMNVQAQRLEYFKGNFSQFQQQFEEKKLAQQRAYDNQQKQIAHIQEFIDRFSMQLPKDQRAKKHEGVVSQIMSKQRQLEKMERVEDPRITYGDDENLEFTFPAVDKLPKDELARLDDVELGYPGFPPLCRGATVRLDLGSRVGVLGRNGAGKSTLLKVITGSLPAMKGDVRVNRNMRVALFAQHHVDTLDLTQTCVECVRERITGPDDGKQDQRARDLLANMGIRGDMALRQVKTLSGGQKSRVALSIAVQCNPHLIVLDEPTNHLDMETIESLIEALKVEKFGGAVVFVSHDQYFLSKVASELWAVADGTVRIFRDLEEAKDFTYEANKAK